MQVFISFWFMRSAKRALEKYLATIASFEANLAVATTARNLNKPLFQDYTLQGRFIGFGLRLLRIIFGSTLYLMIALIFCLIYLFWLTLPFLSVVALIGSVAAPQSVVPQVENSSSSIWIP